MRAKKRAGREGRFKRKTSEVMSASLTSAEIARLNEIAADHGGAGRAIQVAVELLATRKKPVRIPQRDDAKRQPFSFAVFPRTLSLIKHLVRDYGTASDVIRACLNQLVEMEMAEEDRDLMEDLARQPR